MKSPWKNFSYRELSCKCGACTEESGQHIDAYLMDRIQALRNACGFPFVINSAYRCKKHKDESGKAEPGTHNKGLAVDIRVSGQKAHTLLGIAMGMGCFTGIGVSQKGDHAARFIHLDVDLDGTRPWVWSY